MVFKKSLSRLAVAVVASLGAMSASQPASAQGAVDYLWGGGSDWGGGRQTVSFSTQYKPGHVIVSFGDRRLYLVTKSGQAISYPIAVPREQSRWQGTTFVSNKRVNPPWTPTPDMIKENPRLPSWVPGGHPMNPLGVRALYLGSSSYRIHGTDAPWTIGQAVSKGCVRMFNEDVLDLFPRVPVGARVTVTWNKFTASTVASAAAYTPPPADVTKNNAQDTTQTASAKPEPQYEYVDPFTALFGEPEAPPKKVKKPRTTQIKKYSTTASTTTTTTTPAVQKSAEVQ